MSWCDDCHATGSLVIPRWIRKGQTVFVSLSCLVNESIRFWFRLESILSVHVFAPLPKVCSSFVLLKWHYRDDNERSVDYCAEKGLGACWVGGRMNGRNPKPLSFSGRPWQRRIFLSVSYSLIFWHWRIGHHLSMVHNSQKGCEWTNRTNNRLSCGVCCPRPPLRQVLRADWLSKHHGVVQIEFHNLSTAEARDMRHRGIRRGRKGRMCPGRALLLHSQSLASVFFVKIIVIIIPLWLWLWLTDGRNERMTGNVEQIESGRPTGDGMQWFVFLAQCVYLVCNRIVSYQETEQQQLEMKCNEIGWDGKEIERERKGTSTAAVVSFNPLIWIRKPRVD